MRFQHCLNTLISLFIIILKCFRGRRWCSHMRFRYCLCILLSLISLLEAHSLLLFLYVLKAEGASDNQRKCAREWLRDSYAQDFDASTLSLTLEIKNS